MQFDLVAPERRVASLEVDSVELPGSDGDMTIMADHASLVTTLRPGIIRTLSGGNADEHVVTGGFVEVTAKSTSVMADLVIPVEEATAKMIDDIAADESRAAESLEGARRDVADTRIACLKALSTKLA